MCTSSTEFTTIKQKLDQQAFTVSCELFPPKQDADLVGARDVVYRTAQLKPDFISVTFGASGGTSKNTAAMAEYVQQCGVTAIAHLTCVSATPQSIHTVLDDLRAKGIGNILALRGDIPEGMEFPSPRSYHHASDLIEDINAHSRFCIGGACYPEGHVDCANQLEDIENLKRKVDLGCDFLVSQMFFDNDIMFRFLYKAQANGIDVPVLAGIMPITSKKQVARTIKLSGTVFPARFLNILDRFGDDDASMREAGIAYATEQILDLIANGVRGIHVFTMNKPDVAGQIFNNLKGIIASR